jgi:hypothetical protein
MSEQETPEFDYIEELAELVESIDWDRYPDTIMFGDKYTGRVSREIEINGKKTFITSELALQVLPGEVKEEFVSRTTYLVAQTYFAQAQAFGDELDRQEQQLTEKGE